MMDAMIQLATSSRTSIRPFLVLFFFIVISIMSLLRRRAKRLRPNELRFEGGFDRPARADDAIERIGFMFNHREGTFPDRPFLTYRAAPMAEMLAERGMQLFMYSPRHVDLSTGRVTGTIIEEGQYRHVEAEVPLINGNWSLGKDRSIDSISTKREFDTWARERGIERFCCIEFCRLVSDKYRAAQLLDSIAPGLHPQTDLYDPAGAQLDSALERSQKVFLKPRRGNKGDQILIVERVEHGLALSHYVNKQCHKSTAPTVMDLTEMLPAIIGDVQYVIQDGVDVERDDGSSFIFRVIVIHDGQEWQLIWKAVVASESGDVANTTQGGSNHTVEDLLTKLYGAEIAQTIQSKLRTVSLETTTRLDSIYPGQLMEIAYDFVLDSTHEIRLVELNTMPGMVKPGMPVTNAFEDILHRSPSEQAIYERCLVPHARHLVNFLCARHAARRAIESAPAPMKPIHVDSTDSSPARVVFVGDTSFGENYQEKRAEQGAENILETRGYEQALLAVKPMLEAADLVIANLETPFTDIHDSPLAGQKRYVHWSDPTRAPEVLAAHNITAVSLANNHACDFGVEGLQQTFRALEANGIAWFGAGQDRSSAMVPLACDLGVGSGSRRLIVVAGNHRTREHAYHWYADDHTAGVNSWTEPGAVAQIQAYRRAEPEAMIVAYPHWGANYAWRSMRQQHLGRAMIDAGADLVLGHGAHMMQEIERYRNRWIIYSLGNFVFNSPGRYQKIAGATSCSMVASLDVDPSGNLSLRLHPILSDNRITDYQPRPLTEAEARSELFQLFKRSVRGLETLIKLDQDDTGYCLRLTIDPLRHSITRATPSQAVA